VDVRYDYELLAKVSVSLFACDSSLVMRDWNRNTSSDDAGGAHGACVCACVCWGDCVAGSVIACRDLCVWW
jgi:hypothetical protein